MKTAHLFCRVVDNYGDIGIAWRLARGLVARHGFAATLFLDVPAALKPLAPSFAPANPDQVVEGVRVITDLARLDPAAAPDLVLEVLSGTAPDAYVAAQAAREKPPVWIIYEYLSAEDWVATHHLLPSPHPHLPLTRYFFYPGFAPGTGGLLGIPQIRTTKEAGKELSVLLFAYENLNLPALLQAWADSATPVHVTVPVGLVLPQIATFWHLAAIPTAGTSLTRSNLTLNITSMVPLDQFPRLLADHDLNFVRGEDSLTLAILSGQPVIWHLYAQDDHAHHIKLAAFLDLYAPDLPPVWHLFDTWNKGGDIAAAWESYMAEWPKIQARAQQFRQQIQGLGDAVDNLVDFYQKIR